MDVVFYVIAILLVIIVIARLLKDVDRLFGRYGGILGTIVTFAINAVEFGFIFWVISKVIPLVDWELGMYVGLFYCAYCWIFDEENKMADFVIDLLNR